MPISKRDKKIDLTKVKKKSKDKQDIVKTFKLEFAKFKYLYVLRIENYRNVKISEMRQELAGSKFIFGKNSLMSIAVGRTKEEEFMSKMHKLAKFISGQCCLLLTNKRADELRSIFNTFRSQEYARPGLESPQTVILAEGSVLKLPHTMEPAMRQLGLPVKLVRGVVTLDKDHRVCRRGKKLSADQCRILKMFEIQLSEFRVAILASWSSDEGVCDYREPDSYAQITSLPKCVRVTCEKLDDGQLYFVPTAIECDEADESDEEDNEDETNDGGTALDLSDVDMEAEATMCLPSALNKSKKTKNKSNSAKKEALGAAPLTKKPARSMKKAPTTGNKHKPVGVKKKNSKKTSK